MTTSRKRERARNLNAVITGPMSAFRPPEDLTLSEWADKYRRLSPEASAEAGPWRTSRTPYLKEVMDAFTDPNCSHIVFVSASQVGKSEFINNAIGYIVDQDPGSVLFVQPTIDDAKKYSRLRIAPMIRDTPVLRRKIKEVRQGRNNASTLLQKSFRGGMLTMTGSNVASALASTPVRYIFGDERDRWAVSAGTEGDPWELAVARQATFYNAKAVETSTPTVKGASNIAASFEDGTQERWMHVCPHCGEPFEITFDRIHFDPIRKTVHGRPKWDITADPQCVCPHCGGMSDENTMRRQPQMWVATNPEAYTKKHKRSFWLSAFASPWTGWRKIIIRFLEAKDDPRKLQVVYNTLFGQLWEDRGDLATEDEMLARREDYGEVDGRPVELPDGVLVLTCGVDTQDDRLEYEVVGHGMYRETWGIEKGFIMGRPSEPEVWERLDEVLAKPRRYRDGKTLRVSLACVDSGGHYTQEVYMACAGRMAARVFAIKGRGGESVPYVTVPTKVPIRNRRSKVWLYTIGVDAGKTAIINGLKVEEPGPGYCHFPRNVDAGYDLAFFNGLLSERPVLTTTSQTSRWVWKKIDGHNRNEALDCRNYAMAALRILNPSMEELQRQRLQGPKAPKKAKARPRKRRNSYIDDW